jgi:hypothetical protein
MLFIAITIGFIGSLHCFGMCSPLAFAVTNWKTPYFKNKVVYNVFRILSYAMQGGLMSTLGSLFNFPRFQNTLSIILGIVLVFLGMVGVTNFKLPIVGHAMQQFTSWIKTLFSNFLMKRTNFSLACMGFLNGLLPCGLTYFALSYCIILPTFTDGFLFMIFFGMGTLPVMLGFTYVAKFLVNRLTINFQKLTIIALISIGMVLIARGFVQHSAMPTISSSIIVCQPK